MAVPGRVLAVERGLLHLAMGRSLATKRRAARAALRATLPERQVVWQALLVLAFSKQPPLS